MANFNTESVMHVLRTEHAEQKTESRPNSLDVRLGNWGRWSRRSGSPTKSRWFNAEAPNEVDAIEIERAVCSLDGTQHAQLLRAWHQGLAHGSRIAMTLGIPRRSLGTRYRAARLALASLLAKAPVGAVQK